jgi:hypothetical protein
MSAVGATQNCTRTQGISGYEGYADEMCLPRVPLIVILSGPLRPPSCAYNRARRVPWQDNLKCAWKGAAVEDARIGHNVIAGVYGELVGKTTASRNRTST